MKTFGKIVLFVVSLAISIWAAQSFWLHDWSLVTILMASIFLHEVAHWVMLRLYGLRPTMFFVPLLGAAVAAPGIQELNHKHDAIVALAGPSMNFMLFLVGYLLFLNGNMYGIRLASLNASLCWFNLIPLFALDGQRFAKAIYSSLNEKQDRMFASLVSSLAVLVGITLILAGKTGFFYMLIYYGLHRESRLDNPGDSYSRKAMPFSEAKRLCAIYTVMIFAGMVASAFLPYWRK